MDIRYEQVLPGQQDYLTHLAAPDALSSLKERNAAGIAAVCADGGKEELSGFAELRSAEDMELSWLYVARDFRGRGIGSRLDFFFVRDVLKPVCFFSDFLAPDFDFFFGASA